MLLWAHKRPRSMAAFCYASHWLISPNIFGLFRARITRRTIVLIPALAPSHPFHETETHFWRLWKHHSVPCAIKKYNVLNLRPRIWLGPSADTAVF
ncbi:hypothetical protein C8R44DRAFT_766874 [Mycena epipterygia]|nr:hypothetical protein C8R44DRAFT_766874 [Mycena epipterygia]